MHSERKGGFMPLLATHLLSNNCIGSKMGLGRAGGRLELLIFIVYTPIILLDAMLDNQDGTHNTAHL
ncbi:MAG: hypothetical protein L0H53_07650 [Candidatus Nitrosocosmicus sp.]|nr:hypothetical protein [Candidatus Nitrosocosmicus sp.]MDN5867149.1 hypothetical protein [Candidatus Nitrosocosmicus sp.]